MYQKPHEQPRNLGDSKPINNQNLEKEKEEKAEF